MHLRNLAGHRVRENETLAPSKTILNIPTHCNALVIRVFVVIVVILKCESHTRSLYNITSRAACDTKSFTCRRQP